MRQITYFQGTFTYVQYEFLYLILARPKLTVWGNIGITRVGILPVSYPRQLCNKLPTAADKMAYKNTQREKEISLCMFFLCGLDHRVHTEWQRPLSGVHSIMIEKLAQAGDFIYHHMQSCIVRSSSEDRYTDPISSVPICTVLCGLQSRSNIYSPTPITAISEDELKN
jgi:hypothetical protein